MTVCYQLSLEPIDGWYFSEGIPFNQDDDGLALSDTMFPPWPHVAVSAIRTALARKLGWSGKGHWDQNIVSEIGTGLWDLGKLSFSDFCLLRRSKENQASSFENTTRFYPLPRLYVSNSQEQNAYQRLSVGNLVFDCDLSQMNHFVNGFGDIHLLHSEDAWWDKSDASDEKRRDIEKPFEESGWVGRDRRVGIQIDQQSKAVVKGMLYALSQIRMDGETALGFELQIDSSEPGEIENELGLNGSIATPFGGKGRIALLRWAKRESQSHRIKPTSPKFTVVSTSPAIISNASDFPNVGENWPGFPKDAKVTAVTSDRLKRFSAWDMTGRSEWWWSIPSGASFEVDATGCELDFANFLETEGLNATIPDGPTASGLRKLGFGEVALLPELKQNERSVESLTF